MIGSVDDPRSGRNEDLVDQTCPTPRQYNPISRANQSRPQPAEKRRRSARVSGKNPRKVPNLPTSWRAVYEKGGADNTRRDTAWWRWFNHGRSERGLLDTKAQTVGKVAPKRLLGLQAFKNNGLASQHPLLVNFQKTEPPEKQPSKSWELISQGQYGIEELRSVRERLESGPPRNSSQSWNGNLYPMFETASRSKGSTSSYLLTGGPISEWIIRCCGFLTVFINKFIVNQNYFKNILKLVK
jgi:hypothetical protein